jgi:ubiquinone/menaquinone biosynthesis C-methylase UbiE
MGVYMLSEDIQRQHYAQTATSYHHNPGLGQSPEHELALYILLGMLDSVSAESFLDVGAGTGRGMTFLMRKRPDLRVRGIEPVEELRNVAYSNGVPTEWLVSGSGYKLPYPDNSFDIVAEFGVLHHVEKPELVVREMVRVARYGVLLSDTNNLGQGGLAGRLVKNVFFHLGLWKFFSLIRTRGRGYVIEPTDGLWYYYTVFSHFSELSRLCHSVHVMNTRRNSRTPWFSASHAILFATKAAIGDRAPFFGKLRVEGGAKNG